MFNACACEGASSVAHSLKTQGAILSHPRDLLGVSFRRRRLTSSALQLIFSNFLTTTQYGVGKITIIFDGKHRGDVGVHALTNTEVVCHKRIVDFYGNNIVSSSSLGLNEIPEGFWVFIFFQIGG